MRSWNLECTWLAMIWVLLTWQFTAVSEVSGGQILVSCVGLAVQLSPPQSIRTCDSYTCSCTVLDWPVYNFAEKWASSKNTEILHSLKISHYMVFWAVSGDPACNIVTLRPRYECKLFISCMPMVDGLVCRWMTQHLRLVCNNLWCNLWMELCKNTTQVYSLYTLCMLCLPPMLSQWICMPKNTLWTCNILVWNTQSCLRGSGLSLDKQCMY